MKTPAGTGPRAEYDSYKNNLLPESQNIKENAPIRVETTRDSSHPGACSAARAVAAPIAHVPGGV